MHDRELSMIGAILPHSEKVVNTKLFNTESTKKTNMWFYLLPEWSNFFPPFNIAKLSSIINQNGYESRCFDLNIESYDILKSKIESGEIPYDPWDGSRFSKWTSTESYYSDIHPHLEDLYNSHIERIIKDSPKVVGFTLYFCNTNPILWFIKKIKKLSPSTKIVIGGPGVHSINTSIESGFFMDGETSLVDYVVVGEAEELILEILNDVETGITHDVIKVLTQPITQRINIDNSPLPNYDDLDLNLYRVPNGIVTEFSRGCIAKCTFCEETHFWKYRQRSVDSLIYEIEELNKKRGVSVVWFLDSLINGNLKALEEFSDKLIEKNINIKWTGYSRCDKRMDLSYYKKLKEAGCFMLNYGAESGSDKVLSDMDKRVTVSEMEQNFRDSHKVGIGVYTNWIMGFPTETIKDFANTLIFLWRNRNVLDVIVTSNGFVLSPPTITGQNFDRFNLSHYYYENEWANSDFTLTKYQLLERVKIFPIFCEQLVTNHKISIPVRPDLKVNHYNIEYENPSIRNNINFEDFDYNVINTGINKFADSLINENFSLFRVLYKARGGYKIELNYEEEMDRIEFGEKVSGSYNAKYIFNITSEGSWKLDLDISFKQNTNPFKFINFGHDNSNTAIRARKLAKIQNEVDVEKLKEVESELNNTIDFSFTYKNTIDGNWGVKVKSLF